VFGTSTNSSGNGVRGEANGGAQAYGVFGVSYNGIGVAGWSPTGTAVSGSSSSGYAIYCGGSFYQLGGAFTAYPYSTTWVTNKPATVKLNNSSKVKLFAEEAAEVYFNDYGEGRLIQGRTHIELDPIFLQTVTIDARHPMKVFVQLEDECNGVYVANKSHTGFDVVELHRGTSNAGFSYRIVCKRKLYEDERLATEEQDVTFNKRMLETVWPEVIEKQEKMQRQKGR
jgi:hypothetical protein